MTTTTTLSPLAHIEDIFIRQYADGHYEFRTIVKRKPRDRESRLIESRTKSGTIIRKWSVPVYRRDLPDDEWAVIERIVKTTPSVRQRQVEPRTLAVGSGAIGSSNQLQLW